MRLLKLLVLSLCLVSGSHVWAQSNELKKQVLAAQKLHNQGQNRAAAATLQKVVQADPSFADAQRLLGHVLVAQKQPTKARKAFVEAVKYGRLTADVLSQICKIDRDQNQPAKSLAFIRLLLASEPDNKAWALLLLDTLMAANQDLEAAAVLSKLRAADPLNAQLELRRSNLALRQDKRTEARSALLKAWYLGSRNAQVARSIAGLFHSDQSYVNALSWYETARSLKTETTSQTLRRAQVLLKLKDYEAVEQILAKASVSSSATDQRQALQLKAALADAQGQAQDAISSYVALLNLGGGDEATLLYVLDHFRKQDQHEAMLKMLEKHKNRFDSLDLRLLRIDALGHLKRWQDVQLELVKTVAKFGLTEALRQRIQWLASQKP